MSIPRFAVSGLLVLAVFWSDPGHSQAPIERRSPSSPAPLPQAPSAMVAEADRQWQQLERRARHGSSEELRVQANGEPLRCSLDHVTGSELMCTEYRPFSSPLERFFFPPQPFHVPRSDIREVRNGGRELSTLVGAAAGIGLGAGVSSARGGTQSDVIANGLLIGLIGGFIGHVAPFKGFVVYRQP